MAVIGKIRNKAGLLIGIVGFSLVAFILGDLLTSNRSFISGTGTDVGVIAGKKISIQDFEARVAQLEENYKINTGNQTVDQNTLESLREQAWTTLINEEVMGTQVKKAGIKVSDMELFDLVQGKDPHPQIKEAFKDPQTGQFAPSNVLNFLKNMDNDATGKTRAQWIAFEKYIADERVKQKYNNLVRMGMYTTTEEAKRQQAGQNRSMTVRIADLSFRSIPDSSIKVEESEITAYYNAHKEEYKQEEGRKIEYVIFDVSPSPEDITTSLKLVDDLVTAFKETTDDSLFVAVNSDQRIGVQYAKQGTLSPAIDTVFFGGAPAGTVVGPYRENNGFRLSKLVDMRMRPDSIRVSHALVAYAGSERAAPEITRTKEQAKLRADSLFAIAKKDVRSFLDIAKNQSDDKVSAEKEGDLDWMTNDSPMDPQFKEGAFNTAKGSVSLVESPFGFHIIRVADQTATVRQAKVATLQRDIRPSTKTYSNAFSKANEFAGKNTTGEAFNKACEEQGLNKRESTDLKPTDRAIPGLESPRAVIQWAYQAKKGDVSKAFDLGDKFVIAHLKEVKEKGIAPLEQVKELVTSKVANEKKAQQFTEKFNAELAKTKNIDQIATAVGTTVKNTMGLSFTSGYIQNIGVEPAVVGVVSTLKKGDISKPITGQAGVYVVVVDEIAEAPESKDYTATKQQLDQQNRQRAEYEVFNALKEKAGIEDNRSRFY
jgi:peptidyl-prolyl cis-trans isomerase D